MEIILYNKCTRNLVKNVIRYYLIKLILGFYMEFYKIITMNFLFIDQIIISNNQVNFKLIIKIKKN